MSDLATKIQALSALERALSKWRRRDLWDDMPRAERIRVLRNMARLRREIAEMGKPRRQIELALKTTDRPAE